LKEELRVLNNKRAPSPLELWVEKFFRLSGFYDYYREYQQGTFFIDFAFVHNDLAVEIDGSYHKSPAMRDKDRNKTIYLESCGWRVYRIPSSETWNPIKLAIHLKTIYEIVYPNRPLKYIIAELLGIDPRIPRIN